MDDDGGSDGDDDDDDGDDDDDYNRDDGIKSEAIQKDLISFRNTIRRTEVRPGEVYIRNIYQD